MPVGSVCGKVKSPDQIGASNDELAAWNRRRRRFAQKAGMPFIPVRDDREAPPVDEESIRRLYRDELSPEETKTIAYYCWTYPSWIRVATRISVANYLAQRDSVDQAETPPQLG